MNKKWYPVILAVLYILFLSVPFSCASDKKSVEVRKSDKCPVCGMFVARYKNWLSEIIFTDGTYAVFDGPKDMFRYYLDVKKYNPTKKASDISNIYITEYYSTELMDARKVFFVQGSDVNGPMGAELVPLASETAAKDFLKDHKGSRILKFNEVTGEYLK
jgi:nitrous oxide reductase accessory protein NosL